MKVHSPLPIYFLWWFSALALCLGSCSPSKKIMTPAPSVSLHLPDTLPALPASEIDLPIRIYAPPLLARIDSLVPKEFTSQGWPEYLQQSCDFRYKYRFVRSGFTLTCTNNKFGLQMTGHYQVAGSRCICVAGKPASPWISGTCGFGQEPMRKVDLSIVSQLNILPNYRLRSFTRLEQLRSSDKCIVSLFSMDMTQQILDSIRSSIGAICTLFDETTAGMNFTPYLQQNAGKAWEKTPLGPYGYLVVNPLTVRAGAMNYSKDTLSLSIGLTCRPELGSDSNNKPFTHTLPPVISGAGRDGIHLYLPVSYEYPFLTRLVNDSLRNKSFLVKGRTVIIREVALKGIANHQVEVRIDFAGSRKGRIYLRGTPVVDTAKQTLSIPDISYSLESRDLVLKMARSLLRNKIRKSLKGSSYLDMAALIKTNLPAIDAQLSRPLAPGLFSRGKTKEVKVIGLLANEKTLQMQVFVNANLTVVSTGAIK